MEETYKGIQLPNEAREEVALEVLGQETPSEILNSKFLFVSSKLYKIYQTLKIISQSHGLTKNSQLKT